MEQRPDEYITRQSEAVLEYLISLGSNYATVARISKHFKECRTHIGRATIYRQLNKFVRNGIVRKFTFDDVAGVCYQFVPETERESEQQHLKCESCGEVTELCCNSLVALSKHISENHNFKINDSKTIFYGKCKTCLKNT